MSAVMPSEWRKMWIPRCTTSSPQQGGMSVEQAAEYVKQMKKEKRYQRDVY